MGLRAPWNPGGELAEIRFWEKLIWEKLQSRMHPEQATGQHAGRPADEQLNIEQETQPAQVGSSVDLGICASG